MRPLGKKDGVVNLDPSTSPIRVIESCNAVISYPFTSTAILARENGKPSVYYDPVSLIQKDDRGAHGIEILSGIDELREWVARVFCKGEPVRKTSGTHPGPQQHVSGAKDEISYPPGSGDSSS